MAAMRILVVTTVTPDGQTHELAEDCVERFQALEAFIRDAYGKESKDYDLHIHYNRVCNGRNQVTPHTYASLVSSNTLFGKSAESRQCYVCFIPKAELFPVRSSSSPVSELENPPALTGRAMYCSAKPQAQARDSTEDPGQQYSDVKPSPHSEDSLNNFDEQSATQDRRSSIPTPLGRAYGLRTSHRLRNSLPDRSATKRPSDEYPKDDASVKRRRQGATDQLESSTTVIVGAPNQGSPALPPLTSQNLAAATGHSLTGLLLGSADAPWSISSRDSSPAASNRRPSGLEPEGSHQVAVRSEQPVHSEKAIYEFLLSKRLPKSMFMVGTLRPSSLPDNFEPSNDGRVNAVGVQLQCSVRSSLSSYIVNRVSHYALSRDPTNCPLKKPCVTRLPITSVDYFPELQALYDLHAIKTFLGKYRKALFEGRPFENSSVDLQYEEDEEGGEGEEDEEDEKNEGERSTGRSVASLTPTSKVIALRLPRESLGRLRGSHSAEINISADLETTTDSGEKLNQSSDKPDRCSKCRIDGKKCALSGLKHTTGCQRCIILALVCSLSDEAAGVLPGFPHQTRFGTGERNLIATEQQEKGDDVLKETQGQCRTHSGTILFPEDEDDVASIQSSDGISSGDNRPQHLHINADYSLENSNATEIRSHGGTYEHPTPSVPLPKRPHSRPGMERNDQEDMSAAAMTRHHGGHVRLNIMFTDCLDIPDGSRPYDFKRNYLSVCPRSQKPSELLTVLREIIEEEGINTPKRVLTEYHATELEQADLSVAISAVHTDSGTHSMGRKPHPWFKSWNLSANSVFDNLLMKYAHHTVDLSVEMWGKGSHGVNDPSALHKR